MRVAEPIVSISSNLHAPRVDIYGRLNIDPLLTELEECVLVRPGVRSAAAQENTGAARVPLPLSR